MWFSSSHAVTTPKRGEQTADPHSDWRRDLRWLSVCAPDPVVLLAAAEVDENLWQAVLGCDGYDAVRRFADSSEWRRSLQFALLARLRSVHDG